MLPMYNKTIAARCDLGSMVFVHPRVKMAPSASPRMPFSSSGVQNAMDPVTACNNYILAMNKSHVLFNRGSQELALSIFGYEGCIRNSGYKCNYCGSVVAERLSALNSNSGVSDQQSVGSNPQP